MASSGVNRPQSFEFYRIKIAETFREQRMVFSEPGDDLLAWLRAAKSLEEELGMRVETVLNRQEGIAGARLNRGFPPGMTPFSPEAKEWSRNSPAYFDERARWGRVADVDFVRGGC